MKKLLVVLALGPVFCLVSACASATSTDDRPGVIRETETHVVERTAPPPVERTYIYEVESKPPEVNVQVK